MARRPKAFIPGSSGGNQRRRGPSFAEMISTANRRAHEQANRRSGKRELKSVRAAIAATDLDFPSESVDWFRRMMRWAVAAVLLPLCWVTTWTFLSRFFHATLDEGFWQSREFWYFATGALIMLGWFASGLLQSFFLYAYVLGHELTHAVFVLLFRGKVSDFHVSASGGYITTNKTNLVIALSPYFVPFWSVIFAAVYLIARISVDLKPGWDLAFYGIIGFTWTFHMAWTLWMLPRDQPDLKENGTLLSLVIIYLANLVVLVALLCLAEDAPLQNARDFAMEWVRHAVLWSDALWHWLVRVISDYQTSRLG